MSEVEKVTITADEIKSVNLDPVKPDEPQAPEPTSKTPLADRLRDELKVIEAALEPKLQAAKDRLAEIMHSEECNQLRAFIKESQPKLAKVKNELASLVRPTATHRIVAEPGEYGDKG